MKKSTKPIGKKSSTKKTGETDRAWLEAKIKTLHQTITTYRVMLKELDNEEPKQ
jgi:rubrerythrin